MDLTEQWYSWLELHFLTIPVKNKTRHFIAWSNSIFHRKALHLIKTTASYLSAKLNSVLLYLEFCFTMPRCYSQSGYIFPWESTGTTAKEMSLLSHFHPNVQSKQKLKNLAIFMSGKSVAQHQLSPIQTSFDTAATCQREAWLLAERCSVSTAPQSLIQKTLI